MGKTTSFVAAALLAASMGGATSSVAQSNPVDEVSNPGALNYTNVGISPQNMKAPFIRDGVVMEPQRFATIKAGLSQAEVHSMLGDPLHNSKSRGREWNYNFRFKMPQSQNFFVCQYKVVFDNQQIVQDTIWRRRQCERLANGNSAAQ